MSGVIFLFVAFFDRAPKAFSDRYIVVNDKNCVLRAMFNVVGELSDQSTLSSDFDNFL